jgi:RND family efflux transporter MFP subunit
MSRHLSCAAAVLALAVGCGRSATETPVSRPPIVTVSTPIEKEVVDSYDFDGNTAAVATVDIRARVTGYLEKIYFEDGQEVKEGQPLFLIDKRPYQADLDQALAEQGRAEAQAKRLRADFARAERLLPMRTISQEEYDRIAGDLATANAEIESRKAAVEQANLYLHFCAISAPISGRISRREVTEGNLVIANETLLTTIVSIAPIYAYFDVDEPTVLRIRQMIREGRLAPREEVRPVVRLGLDIESGYPHRGEIDFVDNRVDPKTGTLKVRAVFPNQDGVLTPGLHARIEMPLGKPRKALLVSERAIGSSQGQKFVYVVNQKNEVVARPVTVGLLDGHLREIASGLAADERIITNGLQRVRPGMVVDPKPAEMTADIEPAPSSSIAGR